MGEHPGAPAIESPLLEETHTEHKDDEDGELNVRPKGSVSFTVDKERERLVRYILDLRKSHAILMDVRAKLADECALQRRLVDTFRREIVEQREERLELEERRREMSKLTLVYDDLCSLLDRKVVSQFKKNDKKEFEFVKRYGASIIKRAKVVVPTYSKLTLLGHITWS